MNVLIIHDHITDSSRKDETDAVVQARVVAAALERLGHEWMTLGLTLDLDSAKGAIARLQPDLIFNLVEAIDGHGRLIHLAPGLFEALRIPYTGASAEAQFATSGKLIAKQWLRGTGIATPPWVTLQTQASAFKPGRYIIKSVWEHASIGLDEDSIIDATSIEELHEAIESRLGSIGGERFAEQFIDGREFNLALLADEGGPQVLPPAEILFEGYGDAKPKVVGWRAKWEEDSYEYHHTPRQYDFPASDASLIRKLKAIAVDCWQAFGLRGYARVDFRVDDAGWPWVLEINTNPCLSPDAGFAAALERAGIPFDHAIERIVADALTRQSSAMEAQPI
jgi:D-alanine-D-alanine ligase